MLLGHLDPAGCNTLHGRLGQSNPEWLFICHHSINRRWPQALITSTNLRDGQFNRAQTCWSRSLLEAIDKVVPNIRLLMTIGLKLNLTLNRRCSVYNLGKQPR